MASLDWQQCRIGFLFGHFDEDDNSCVIECLYEPPQNGNASGVEVMNDPNEERVSRLAALLNVSVFPTAYDFLKLKCEIKIAFFT